MTALGARVRRWRDALAEIDPAGFGTGLSPAGARAAWRGALALLDDNALQRAWDLRGLPYHTAAFVASSNVFTAPLEWCAVLLGRGTAVVLKHPREQASTARVLADVARRHGLALTATADPDEALDRADLVVAMGTDATIDAIRARCPRATVLGFGHRVSLGWITDPASFPALADDAALHDGRGCMSPCVVATPLPVDIALDALGAAMTAAQERLPLGAVTPEEAVAIRHRGDHARVVGHIRTGEGWSLHQLPVPEPNPNPEIHGDAPRPWIGLPEPLPRSITLYGFSRSTDGGGEAFLRWLATVAPKVSTVSTDDAAVAEQIGAIAPHVRVCTPGSMQHPPLWRLHDGTPWIEATIRRVPDGARQGPTDR